MRKIISAAFVSLDGVMQAPGGPEEDPSGGFPYGGWTVPYFDDEALGKVMDEIFSQPFDLLLGRKTYDIFAAYWPHVGAGDRIGALFNRVNKYVASRNPRLTLGWQNSHLLGGDVVTALKDLKNGEGPDLLTQGSSDFLQTLLKNELVDEIRLLIFPVVLAKGKRFFGDGASASALKLVDSTVSGTGVTINRYVPAGAVVTGSFALEQPTEAELERRNTLN